MRCTYFLVSDHKSAHLQPYWISDHISVDLQPYWVSDHRLVNLQHNWVSDNRSQICWLKGVLGSRSEISSLTAILGPGTQSSSGADCDLTKLMQSRFRKKGSFLSMAMAAQWMELRSFGPKLIPIGQHWINEPLSVPFCRKIINGIFVWLLFHDSSSNPTKVILIGI